MTTATLTPPSAAALAVDPDRVPRHAMRFGVGSPLQFGAVAPDEVSMFPFTMQVRSAEPISHWYWGRIVHDLSGMTPRNAAITVDWKHRSDEILGYADKFAITETGLQIGGHLISLAPGDRAHDVYRLATSGVPFEASIDWDDPETEIEFIGEGDTAAVNQLTVEGPIHIVRRWALNGAAVCRYGQDQNTSTKFSGDGNAEETRAVRLFAKDSTVTLATPTPAAAPDKPIIPAKGTKFSEVTIDTEDLAAAITAAVETLVAESSTDDTENTDAAPADGAGTDDSSPVQMSLATVRQYHQLFGAKAAEYLAANLPLPIAGVRFVAHQRDQAVAQLTAVTAERDELRTKLAQFAGQLGEDTPVDTGGAKAPPSELEQKLSLTHGDNRAKFAAAMKRRGDKSA